MAQAEAAAEKENRFSAVIYQIGRSPITVALPTSTVAQLCWGPTGDFDDWREPMHTSFSNYATLVREMIGDLRTATGLSKKECSNCGGDGWVEAVLMPAAGTDLLFEAIGGVETEACCPICRGTRHE